MGNGDGGKGGSPFDSTDHDKFKKVRVEGVRRVWGTMSVTSTSSLKTTITKLTSTDLLLIKRKTITDNTGQVKRWWFVLRDVLQELESKWDIIKTQTGWKLELCFKPQQIVCPDANTNTNSSVLISLTMQTLLMNLPISQTQMNTTYPIIPTTQNLQNQQLHNLQHQHLHLLIFLGN